MKQTEDQVPKRVKLGINPLQKASGPSSAKVLVKQEITPEYESGEDISLVLTTSNGEATIVAINPAENPHKKCKKVVSGMRVYYKKSYLI